MIQVYYCCADCKGLVKSLARHRNMVAICPHCGADMLIPVRGGVVDIPALKTQPVPAPSPPAPDFSLPTFPTTADYDRPLYGQDDPAEGDVSLFFKIAAVSCLIGVVAAVLLPLFAAGE